jgi:hypothetical protein
MAEVSPKLPPSRGHRTEWKGKGALGVPFCETNPNYLDQKTTFIHQSYKVLHE